MTRSQYSITSEYTSPPDSRATLRARATVLPVPTGPSGRPRADTRSALVSQRATVTYGQISDPWGTLLVSRALATHGTIRLESLEAPYLDVRLGYRLFERGGHQYLVYPLGTPLFNPWTLDWNREPSVDTEPWARFNWRYPQFLHDGDRHRARMVEYFARHTPPHPLPRVAAGDILTAEAEKFDVLGFDRTRAEGRWTLLQVAELLFEPAPDIGALSLTYGTNGSQFVRISLNDRVLFEGRVDAAATTLDASVPTGVWKPGVNRLRFTMPEARRRRRGDPRTYGVVVKQVAFR